MRKSKLKFNAYLVIMNQWRERCIFYCNNNYNIPYSADQQESSTTPQEPHQSVKIYLQFKRYVFDPDKRMKQ